MTGISIFFTEAILTRNLVFENASDGILVQSTNGLIDRNRSERNGDDGIDVDVGPFSPPHGVPVTISNNFASFNGDLGIEAFPGVTDGGGNKAHWNGNPAQCLNVRCK